MQLFRHEQVKIKVSIVIGLIDAFNGQRISASTVQIIHHESKQKPIKKQEGYIIYTDLPCGKHKFHIKINNYLEREIEVELTEESVLPELVEVSFYRSPTFPFQDGITIVRAAMRNEKNTPVCNVVVQAVVQSEDAIRAKVAQDMAEKGNDKITLVQLNGKLSVGDQFYIVSGKSSEQITIKSILNEKNTYQLTKPLVHSFKRGTALYPLIETRSDKNGEVALFFQNYNISEYTARIDFFMDNNHAFEEVNVVEGTEKYIGLINI